MRAGRRGPLTGCFFPRKSAEDEERDLGRHRHARHGRRWAAAQRRRCHCARTGRLPFWPDSVGSAPLPAAGPRHHMHACTCMHACMHVCAQGHQVCRCMQPSTQCAMRIDLQHTGSATAARRPWRLLKARAMRIAVQAACGARLGCMPSCPRPLGLAHPTDNPACDAVLDIAWCSCHRVCLHAPTAPCMGHVLP